MSEQSHSADDFVFREITAADGETMTKLAESNPDGGEIQFAPQFEVNPYEAYTKLNPANEFVGFIAEAPDGDAAGMGLIAIDDARIGGEIRKRGYLAGLVVDHEYRGMGLAKRLAAKRIDYARTEYSTDIVITAAIQTGNDPSMAVAKSWANRFPYEYVNQPVETLDTPPAEYDIRSATDDELSEFTMSMNAFYGEAELYSPYQSKQLAELLDTAVNGQYIHRCEVVVEDGDLIAGAHVVDHHKLMSAVITELPPELEEADELPPSIPDDLEMRPSFVVPWFKSGQEEAAEALIQHERATAGDANRLMFLYDPEGPLGRLDSLTPDEGAIDLNWAVNGLEEPVDDGFVAPGLG